jgi:hypothetical protein
MGNQPRPVMAQHQQLWPLRHHMVGHILTWPCAIFWSSILEEKTPPPLKDEKHVDVFLVGF